MDRPKSIGQAHRMFSQMGKEIEVLRTGHRAAFNAGFLAGELEGEGGKIICNDLMREVTDKAYADFLSKSHVTKPRTDCEIVLGNDTGQKCPKCGGEADNGNDRCIPPNPYHCTKCFIGHLKPF